MEILIDEINQEIDLFPKTIEEEIVRNIGIILSSPKYSVPLDRDFGTSHKQVDTPVNTAQPKIVMEIADAIEKYEPRAEITRIEFKTDEARQGKLAPIVGVKLKVER